MNISDFEIPLVVSNMTQWQTAILPKQPRCVSDILK